MIALYAWIRFKKISLRVSRPMLGKMLAAGLIVGVHWFFFYHAIKVSNVSAALAGFSTITLFASVMQPVMMRTRFFAGDLIYGLVIAIGLIVILNFEGFYFLGILYGIIAAFTGAFFGVYNGVLVKEADASVITFYEFAGAFVLLSLTKLLGQDSAFIAILSVQDWIYLLLLSVACTALAFTLSVEILKQFSPLTVIITNNLEPIYGIVFSVLIFGASEYMSTGFYAGTGIILASVFTYPLIAEWYKRKVVAKSE
jgi:drug/metabolite transporter (DMT)-like permease